MLSDCKQKLTHLSSPDDSSSLNSELSLLSRKRGVQRRSKKTTNKKLLYVAHQNNFYILSWKLLIEIMFPSWSLETMVTSKIGRGLHQPIYNFSLMNEVIIATVLKYQISACYFSFNYVAFP